MGRLIALFLCLLLSTGAVVIRRGGGGGGPTPEWTLGFEDASTASTCDAEDDPGSTPDTDSNVRDCECQTGAGCASATRPTTIPEGSEVMELGPPSGNSAVRWVNVLNDAGDDTEEMWFRMCMYVETSAAATIVNIWESVDNVTNNPSGPELRYRGGGTDDIRIACEDGTSTGSVALTHDTWIEVSWYYNEDTDNGSLWLSTAASGGDTDQSADSSCSDTDDNDENVDGFRFFMPSSVTDKVWIDELRYYTSSPGAPEGC